MKGGSEYAKHIRKAFQQWSRKHGKPEEEAPTDPLEELVVGILAICTTLHKARTVFRKLSQHMVDFNELRVTPPMELADLIGDGVPLAEQKAQRIVDALNDVRRRQDRLDLSFLKQRARREAREYLESLEGVDRSAAANVVLFSLGGHAIPVDDLTLYVLRKEELVDPSADAAEVQGFLERHISAADARAFTELLGRFVASHGSRVPIENLDELLNPPLAEPEPEPAAEPPAEEKSTAASQAKAATASGKKTAKRTKGTKTSSTRSKTASKSRTAPTKSKKTTTKRTKSGTKKNTKAKRR